ncbi:hypothetical protein, partial [Rheinheimera maricola]
YSNNRQNASLIRYQAFDDPAEAAVVSISEPEGVTTTIARDNFGKPLSVTRSGGGKTGNPALCLRCQRALVQDNRAGKRRCHRRI